MTRKFTTPSQALRCRATRKPLRDGTTAQCMKPRQLGSAYCVQHTALLGRGFPDVQEAADAPR